MNLNTEAFIQAVREELLGFSLGKPWRFTEQSLTCVVPIIRALDQKPGYMVLSKAKNIDIKDTGNIYKVSVTNNESLPIFIRIGELFKGSTQERAATRSFLVMPKETVDIDVNCVHQTKGIVSGTKFVPGGYVPERDALYVKHMYEGKSSGGMYGMGGGHQYLSWNADKQYTTKIKSCTSHASGLFASRCTLDMMASVKSLNDDNIVEARDKVNEILKDVLEKVPLFDNQIGIILIDKDGFHSLDCYDLHASWKDVKEAIIGKESISIAESDDKGVFQYKPENAHSSIKELLEKGFEKKTIFDSGYEVIGIKYNKFVGEVTLLDGNVIHLLITRS
jgi:hypothetical protein